MPKKLLMVLAPVLAVTALTVAIAASAAAASPPTVEHVRPNKGFAEGGTSVEITGTGLLGVKAVKFGSTNAASFQGGGECCLTATSPAGTGTVDVTVTTSEGTSATSSADQFTFVPFLGPPHYYKNGGATPIPEGEKVPFISWGKLTFTPEPAGSPAFCETSAGGYVENPAGGGAGVGKTLRFASWNCVINECPAGEVEIGGKKYEKEFEVIWPAQDFPWPSTLTEEEAGVVRTNSSGVVMELGCVAKKLTKSEAEGKTPPSSGENEQYPLGPFVTCVTTATNLRKPRYENGANFGNNQSKLVFDEGGGKLSCAGGAFEAKTKESLKVMGFKGSELIKAHA
jgi:IPT/TIG domain